MPRLTLHLAFHLHHPPGTPEPRVRASVEDCFEPLTALLEQHPGVDAALHVGGHLLEWFEANDRALADRLAALVSAGEVEIIGGGFYSPLLALLLWRDAVGQLEMTAGFLERRTGVRPSGAWLIEQVWMPRMAEILSDAGVRWTLMDERAIRAAGVEGAVDGWFVTEHAARPVAIFPVDHALRRDMATLDADAVVSALAARAPGSERELVLTWAGDVARLIEGPERGLPWLQRLFARLDAEVDWLEVVRPSQTLDRVPASGRTYLPDSLHPDLVPLTLHPSRVPAWRRAVAGGAEAGSPALWLRGSVWQSFLARYREADRMHKRMIEVARRFAALERVMRNHGFRAMSQLTRPRRMLYRGQAGAAYGHGHDAGIHDPALRNGVYRHLIAAEQACDALVGEQEGLEVGLRDLFADMTTSVLVRSADLRVVLHPASGGAVVGLEHRPTRAAWHDVLTRREEAYHGAGEQGVDGHDRSLLQDRLLTPGAPASAWMDDSAERADLLHADYRLLSVDDSGRGADARAAAHLAGDGQLQGRTPVAVAILKELEVAPRSLRVTGSLSFEPALPEALDAAVELNLSALGEAEVHVELDGASWATITAESPACELPEGSVLRLIAGDAALRITMAEPRPRVSLAPIVTVAQPIDRASRACFQGVAVLLRWPLCAGARQHRYQLVVRPEQA